MCMHSGMAHFATTLPPILQLLLLKLLYISGGPYLYLACEAVPHISALFPRSSKLSLFMMERYKSHWAYFCLIRYIVLGERIKTSQSTNSISYTYLGCCASFRLALFQ